jgi:hypothetical protein
VLTPRQFLLTALLLGAALWVSRAVVDTTADGLRVAYLPSAPELLGLAVLGGLILTLIQGVVERGLGRVRTGAHVPLDAVVPLIALLLLLLPFLPWLSAVSPLSSELAGPLAWWVWTAAVFCAIWALAASLPPRVPDMPKWLASIGVAVGTAALLLLARAQLTPSAVYPGGDEPHYLVLTQSILDDGDLRIDDNHARADYRAYFNAPLKPDHIVPPASDGAIYSIHPVGVSLIVAPGFRAGGYAGASLTIALVGTLAGLLLWRALSAITGSTRAATFGWLAIVTSAPFVLHGFAIYPEIPAACATVFAVLWRRQSQSLAVAVVRGIAIGVLPWLGTKYAPMAAVVALLIVWRSRGNLARVAATALPALALGAAWLAWFWWIWGTPLPTAPYGTAHQMAISHLAAGLPGLFFDQEYGVFSVAPVLAFAIVGWWRLWRTGGDMRALARETLLPMVALALTVGAYAMWWGGSAPPGRQITAALPLLGVPLAVLWQSRDTTPAGRAMLVVLLATGAVATGMMVIAREGLLIANLRDGTSALIEFLSPSGTLNRLLPSFTADRTALGAPFGRVTFWLSAGAIGWWIATRARALSPGRAGLAAAVGTIAAVVIAGAVAYATTDLGIRRPPVQSTALDGFDSLARPVGVVFDPWRLTTPSTIPPLVRFEATPGARTGRQPLPVLLNMRLALPAGTYSVRIEPKPGESLAGEVGLQVGRTGPPQHRSAINQATDAAWSDTFTLDVDANFVGFRAADSFAARVGRIVVAPVTVVDESRRPRRPQVVASAMLAGRPAYFHDTNADLEPTGFWARGNVATALTLSVDPQSEPRGVRVLMHSGQGSSNVKLATGAWSTEVALTPGHIVPVMIPALPAQRVLPLTIVPTGGFVPSEHGGAPGDRRLLGCWIEVVP